MIEKTVLLKEMNSGSKYSRKYIVQYFRVKNPATGKSIIRQVIENVHAIMYMIFGTQIKTKFCRLADFLTNLALLNYYGT